MSKRPSLCLWRYPALCIAALTTAACGSAPQTQSMLRLQEQAQPRSATAPGTAYLRAERADALFAAMPASIGAAIGPNGRGTAPAARVADLRQRAERAYAQEGIVLRESLLTDPVLPADTDAAGRSFAALAIAHDAVMVGGHGDPSRRTALQAMLTASPDREMIVRLVESMAAPKLVREQALTARRMRWALDGTGRPIPSEPALSEQVADLIEATRQDEDHAAARVLDVPGAIKADHVLVEALLNLTPADRVVLTTWYASSAGKAAKDKLVGNFQGANDRAARLLLIDFLPAKGW